MQKNLLIILLFFVTTTTLAQSVYIWKDGSGAIYYGDSRPTPGATLVNVGKINVYETDRTQKSRATTTTARKAPQQKQQPEIVMYSAVWCGVCKQAKDYFAKNKVRYTDYDVETSAAGKAFYAKMEKKTVPIFLIDGEIQKGFTTAIFDRILSLN
jgi:glutaredoxin